MADLLVRIYTFTNSESAAVFELVDAMARTAWARIAEGTVTKPRRTGRGMVVVHHKPLSAQGNVIAAQALAGALAEGDADYHVFYGCCGVIDEHHIGAIFRVASASYLSLGVVRNAETGDGWEESPPTLIAAAGHRPEVVKLKNKWIVQTTSGQAPIPTIELPAGAAGQPGPLEGIGIPDAHVLATDKVIKVAPAATAPQPKHGAAVYDPTDWTYAQAIAQYTNSTSDPVLIDMESFGIAAAALAHRRSEGVLILRVATDALTNKDHQGDDEQSRLLHAQLPVLAAALGRIIDLSG